MPIGPDIQYTAQDDGSYLKLRIYTGADASYTLYEDDGVSYGYEKGEYSTIPISWREGSSRGTLTIGRRSGSFPGMSEGKRIEVEIISAKGIQKREINYTGEEAKISFSCI